MITVTLCACDCAAAAHASNDLYVSPSGTDRAACSRSDPCTIDSAQARARQMATRQRADLRINFLEGTYSLGKPIELVENGKISDSGHNGHRVIWQADAGVSAVLSGAVSLKDWTLYDARRGIWSAPIRSRERFRNFYVNGRRAVRAHTRNLFDEAQVLPSGFGFADGPDVSSFRNLNDVELVATWEWQLSRCSVVSATAAQVQVAPVCFANSRRANRMIYLENAFELLKNPGDWYLDRSGAIAGAAAIYYMPRPGEDPQRMSAQLSGTEQLVSITGTPDSPVHDVQFKGLSFLNNAWFVDKSSAGRAGGYSGLQAGVYFLTPFSLRDDHPAPIPPGEGFYNPEYRVYADYMPAAVSINYAHDVRIEGNRFAHIGSTALAMVHGIQRAVVSGNTFSDISGAAVQLGGVGVEDHHPCADALPCASKAITRDNVIANNLITDAAVEFFDAAALFVGYARNTSILRNEISNVSYTAISVGYGWGYADAGGRNGFRTPTISAGNRVVGNSISGHMRLLSDGAGIYTLGAQPDSFIEDNYIRKAAFVPSGGIYLDEGTSGISVRRNVVVDAMYFVHINCSPYDDTFGNSIVENFSDNGIVFNSCLPSRSSAAPNGGANEVRSNAGFSQSAPPVTAQAIMDAAGLEPAFRYLRDLKAR